MDLATITLREALAAKNKNRTEEHIEDTRRAQEKIGKLLEKIHDQNLIYQTVMFRNFIGSWVAPREQVHDGVLIYLHGGGYCCGNLEYAKGFASVLADKYKIRVFAAAYRLAPEYPYPAALEDAEQVYDYICNFGYDSHDIVLIGESAGGGLVNALCMKLRDESQPLPAGLISISPWTDLTMGGDSYVSRAADDVALNTNQINFYADIYTNGADASQPYISPVFGDVSSFPPSLIFVGSDEILYDDAVRLYDKLQAAGVKSELHVGEGLWHVYPLYGIKESKPVYDRIHEFLNTVLNDKI